MKKAYSFSESPQDLNIHLPSFLVLFDESFSIDWVVELTKNKISDTLAMLEQQVQKGLLTTNGTGIYRFKNAKKKNELLDRLSPEEQERGRRQIVELLLREIPDEDPGKAQILGRHLLELSNVREWSRWLLRAGDINLKMFNNEEALRCYKKVLDDLKGERNEEMDAVFVEAAVKYSKISIGERRYRKDPGFSVQRAGPRQALEKAFLRTRSWKCMWPKTNGCSANIEAH